MISFIKLANTLASISKKDIEWREQFINKRPAAIKPIIPGTKIYLVNGTVLRSTVDSDFVEAGNWERYAWIPKYEIWIDDTMPVSEMYYSLLHESVEAMHMQAGDDYDTAHTKAKRLEDELRHKQLPPGELEPVTK